ncbi:MAG: PQQ-binding-like beta-propeller repeat protein [Candidatus Korarchaeum sp.]
MKGKLFLLLLLLIATLRVTGYDFSPSEVSSIRAYSSKPLFTIPAPVIYGDSIYAAGGQGDTLLAVSLRGEVLWSQRVGGFIATPPLLIPDVLISPTRREAWVVVLTESNELRAFDAKTGGLRLYNLFVPSPSARVGLQYAGDGRTVIVPLQSSIQVIDIKTKSEIWFKNLTFRILSLKYINNELLAIGEKNAVLLDMRGNSKWEISFNIRIEAFGADSNYLAVLLENKTLLSFDLRNGAQRSSLDLSSGLGYTAPRGEFPVVGGVAVLTGSSGIVYQVDLRKMELRRSIKTWAEPVKQPSIVENALLYFSKGGLVRVYHLPSGIRLSDVRVGGEIGSDVVLQVDPVNRSYYSVLFDDSGTLRIIRFPELWIKLLEVREEGGGYLIEGYVCSTAAAGSPAPINIYTLDSEGKLIGEKPIGSVSPGQCGARFSTFLKSRGAVGLISGGFKFPPNLVVGISPEEWISMKPGATTTTKPEVVPSLSYEAPTELKVGEEFVVRVMGINGWRASNLTLILAGEGIEEVSKRLDVDYGSSFDIQLMSVAKRRSEDLRLILMGDGVILLEETLPVRVERGKLLESLEVPTQVEVNRSFRVNLTLVNRYEDGQRFRVVVSLGDLREEELTAPLAAGASQTLKFSLRSEASGSSQLITLILSQDGTELEEHKVPILVIQPVTQPSVTQTTTQITQTVSGVPIPMEYLIAAVISLMAVAVAASLARPKPRKPERKVEVIVPKEVPPAVTPEEVEEVVEEVAEEYPLERIPFELEEFEKPTVPLEERPSVPEVRPPAEAVERLERDLKALNTKLEDLKGRMRSIEDLIGFEVSPYRMVDAEASLVNAELKLREGSLDEAERLIRSTRESLDVLTEEVKDAERVFRENWGAVENRIEIMLRVWGKAPATMLTMVPPSFRIAALERYMRMHKEKRLELRGDELVSIS